MYIERLYIYITNKCNFKCKYCFIDKKEGFSLSWKQVISEIEKLKKNINTIKSISILGGEPLIVKNFKEVKFPKNIYIDITTNGTKINKEIYKTIQKNEIKIYISLDGTLKINDQNRIFLNKKISTYNSIIKNLEIIPPSNRKAKLIFTKETLDSLPQSIIHLYDKNFTEIRITPKLYEIWNYSDLLKLKKKLSELKTVLQKKGLSKKDIFYLFPDIEDAIKKYKRINQKKDFFCDKLVLAPDGNYYACDELFRKIPPKEEYIIGNITSGISLKLKEKIIFQVKNEIKKLLPQNYYFFYCPMGLYFAGKSLNFYTKEIRELMINQNEFSKIFLVSLINMIK